MYSILRENVVNNVLKQYARLVTLLHSLTRQVIVCLRTGYVWEQYNDRTGDGQGCKPFTGWSALTVLMMGETF